MTSLPLIDGPVVAVGHSMGAQVVATLAIEHPRAVRALVVITPAYGADEAEERLIPAHLARPAHRGRRRGLRRTCPVLAVHNVPQAARWEESLPGRTNG